jgi:multifunctional beta-oxidation protein
VGSAEDGEKLAKVAMDKFGGVHILIANAGILRDRSFAAMTEQEWDAVMAVHLRYASFAILVYDDTDDHYSAARTRSE